MLKDAPITEEKDDLLGFADAIAAMATELCSETSSGEIFGVFGPWGAGKTSFLNLLSGSLNEDCVWIEFDALRHQATADVLTALLAHVARAVANTGNDAGDSFWRVVNALSLSVADIAVRKVTGGMKLEDIKRHFDTTEGGVLDSPADVLRSTMEKFVGMLAGEEAKRVIVAVDNLDRCRPDAALKFIESLMLFREIEGLRVIVAADRKALVGFIDQAFGQTGFSGALYMEKILSRMIFVPGIDWRGVTEEEGGELAARLIGMVPFLKGNYDDQIRSVFMKVEATRNPRRLKRCVARLSHIKSMNEKDAISVVAVVMAAVLSETWPKVYSYFWTCSERGWNLMLVHVRNDGGDSPIYISEQCKEFLRELENAMAKNSLSQHKKLKNIVGKYRRQLRL